jgi:tripartite-type tricarboxylate transporter receptor subunit TctC
MLGSLPATLPHVRSQRLRPVAITSLKRSTIVPDMPTVAESGYPRFEANTWYGLFAPGGTPPAIVDRLNAEFVKVIGTPEFKAWLMKQGAEAVTSTPDDFAAFVRSEIALYGVLVKKYGMKAD